MIAIQIKKKKKNIKTCSNNTEQQSLSYNHETSLSAGNKLNSLPMYKHFIACRV